MKIVLLGDSIRLLGYGKRVEEILNENGHEVWQPEDNCRFAAYTFRMLYDIRPIIESADIVHFNCGLWDITDIYGDGPNTPLQSYVDTVLRIVRIVKKYFKKDGKIIFATTTLPKPRAEYYTRELIPEYNNAVVKALLEEGVIINDLYTLTKEKNEEMICDDRLHLSETGIQLAADQTVKCILDVLNNK